MRNKTKIIAGIGVATTMVGGVLTYPITPGPISPQDWQTLSTVYSYEIKQMGGVNFTNIKKDNILAELNKKIKNRKQTTDVKINGRMITAQDYDLLRADLINKTENTSLFNKIVKQIKL